MSGESLLTYEDVEAYTGYSRRFVQLAVSRGVLKWTGSPAAKRFHKADVDAWLALLSGVDPKPPRKRKQRPYEPVYVKR